MSYIRTKDNIIEIDENGCVKEFNLFNKKVLFAFKDKKYSYRFENGKEILKQSENLEELCDEFVIALKDSKKNPNDNMYDKEEYYSIFQRIGYAKDYYNEDYNDLYGAIWTSKGLIYVAKMNSEGKLVLI